MKKVNLLALAALTAASSAFAEKYEIITNGELNSAYTVMANEAEVHDEMAFGQTGPDGQKCATFKHNAEKYQGVMIDLSEKPIDLSKAWIFQVEFAVPESELSKTSLSYAETQGEKRPKFKFGLFNVDLDAKPELDINKADAVISLDGLTNGSASYRTFTSHIYTPATSANVLEVTFCFEVPDAIDPAFIKNLAIVSDDAACKPFFAEDFNSYKGQWSAWADGAANAPGLDGSKLASGKTLTVEDITSIKRQWSTDTDEATGEPVKFLHTETFHALLVDSWNNARFENLAIPADANGKLYISMLAKWFWSETDEYETNEKYDGTQTMPTTIKFNTGESVEVFPGATMPGVWSELTSTVDIPAGATSFTFDFTTPEHPYLVDNLQISACPSVDVEEATAAASVVVTPNPATDVITVAGAEKIEVLALNGTVLASAEGEKANVAALAAGPYIVKATTANGTAFATIIKK